jgi:hypothetical protein
MPPSTAAMLPSPKQIFARFERGEIERDELHAMMAAHARELITEMEQDYQDPAAAWIEALLARTAAALLVRKHGSRLIREILTALSEVPDFPDASHLWNADHPEVPIHCFLRIRREPVFRIVTLRKSGDEIELLIEHGKAGRGQAARRLFVLKRDDRWRLRAETG